MRRITRILGVIGGIGAIVWAMRDRFVSVAIPREPTPPTFRLPEPAVPSGSNLTEIDGIDPVFAQRLAAAGYRTIADLAAAQPSAVAEAAQVSEARARRWIEAANR